MTTLESGTADDTTEAKNDDVEKEATAMPVDTDTKTEPTHEDTAETDEDAAEGVDDAQVPDTGGSVKTRRQIRWSRVFVFGVLPALALLLALGAGFLKWQDSTVRDSQSAQIGSVQAAKDSTVALLSYRPDTVEKDLGAARDLLTGNFKNAYIQLTNDVVIPGAKQKQITAVASVPAAAAVSATANHAVVLVFVNQTVIVGTDAPTDTASSVKVALDNVGGRWLISDFTPV